MFLFHNRNVITKEFYKEEKEEEQLEMADPQTSLISQLKQFAFHQQHYKVHTAAVRQNMSGQEQLKAELLFYKSLQLL